MIRSPIRRLAYMFLSLPYHSKVSIAVNLELIENSDKDLDELEKTQNYFKRASARGILYELWDEVAKIREHKLTNPFIK